jgi:hypothetical protein
MYDNFILQKPLDMLKRLWYKSQYEVPTDGYSPAAGIQHTADGQSRPLTLLR